MFAQICGTMLVLRPGPWYLPIAPPPNSTPIVLNVVSCKQKPAELKKVPKSEEESARIHEILRENMQV